jgi:hypothetical protein
VRIFNIPLIFELEQTRFFHLPSAERISILERVATQSDTLQRNIAALLGALLFRANLDIAIIRFIH